MWAENVDFRDVDPPTAQITTDAEILLGATVAPNIRKGVLTSSDGSVTYAYSEPTAETNALDLVVAGGATVGKTITGDSGGALSPTAGNWDILGLGETSTSGAASALSILSPRVAQYIVDPVANVGTHVTIASAISAASSGETIFIRPGTYTENLILKEGVNLTAFKGELNNSTVTILGKLTVDDTTGDGLISISNIQLQTNSDYLLETTGNIDTAQVKFYQCYLDMLDNTGINMTGNNKNVVFEDCEGVLGTTGITLYTKTSTAALTFNKSRFFNAGSTTASTNSAGSVNAERCTFTNSLSSSGTGTLGLLYCRMPLTSRNITAYAHTGTGQSILEFSNLASGTATALTVGAGGEVLVQDCILSSSNANTVSGAGTCTYGLMLGTGNAPVVGTTSTGTYSTATGPISFDDGANYLDYYEEGDWTPALTGASGAPTIAYTSQVGTYTRIGNVVVLRANIVINTISGGSGSARMTGLPFTVINSTEPNIGSVQFNNVNFAAGAAYLTSRADANTTYVRFYETNANAGGATVSVTDFANGDNFAITLTYRV